MFDKKNFIYEHVLNKLCHLSIDSGQILTFSLLVTSLSSCLIVLSFVCD